MRVVLIGSPRDRARVRASLEADADGVEVIAEAATLGVARAEHPGADAYLIAAGRERDPFDPPDEPLTARELDVLDALAHGLTNKSIAGRLGISDQTVKFHLASICAKLGAANRTDAVRRAVRRGLIAL